jgi:DUF1707 SHOCT-like domain
VSEGEDLFVGDAERESAASDLRRHYDAGRLTLEEFEGRLDSVQRARTESDLTQALRQLPLAKLPSLRPRDTRWRSLAVQYLIVNVIATLVWLASGAQGDFWPRWVLVATLIMFMRRLLRPSGSRHRPLPPPDPPQLP